MNFTYLCRGDGYAQTIEFRQARGTLAVEEVHHWVDFCVALVRLAEFHANNPGQFPIDSFESRKKHGEPTAQNPININRLMDAMGLSEDAKAFWGHKSAEYAMYVEGDKNDRTDNEEPPQDEPYSGGDDGHSSDGGDDHPPKNEGKKGSSNSGGSQHGHSPKFTHNTTNTSYTGFNDTNTPNGTQTGPSQADNITQMTQL